MDSFKTSGSMHNIGEDVSKVEVPVKVLQGKAGNPPSLALQPRFELDSPKFSTGESGIFTLVPQLSFVMEVEAGF
jgi:hypothetical protein